MAQYTETPSKTFFELKSIISFINLLLIKYFLNFLEDLLNKYEFGVIAIIIPSSFNNFKHLIKSLTEWFKDDPSKIGDLTKHILNSREEKIKENIKRKIKK